MGCSSITLLFYYFILLPPCELPLIPEIVHSAKKNDNNDVVERADGKFTSKLRIKISATHEI